MSSSGVKVRDSAAIPPGTARERAWTGGSWLRSQIPELKFQPYHFLTGMLGLLSLSGSSVSSSVKWGDDNSSFTKIK